MVINTKNLARKIIFAAIFLATYSIGNLPILKASDVMFIDSDNSPGNKFYCVLYCYSESST